MASRKMAALSVAVVAHNPGGKDEKVWSGSTDEVREASLEMAKAAKAKNATGWKEAVRRMDNACTKCHEVFRKEE